MNLDAAGAARAGVREFRPDASLANMKTAPRRNPWVLVAAVVVLVLTAMLVHSLLTNPNYDWAIVGEYMFNGAVVAGLRRTLELTVICMALSFVLGIVVASMRLSSNPVLSGVALAYVWFFRGVPLLVQLIFWFNLGALYPSLSIGVPFGPEAYSAPTNQLINPYTAAILGLALNEAAYMAEIVRAGIASIDPGQIEAAQALSLTKTVLFRRIILPQAMRVIVPPTGNETITMLKYTSLVSVIALPELLYSTQIISSQNFQVVPLLIVASLWYLVMVSILMVVQQQLERRFSRSTRVGRTMALPSVRRGRVT